MLKRAIPEPAIPAGELIEVPYGIVARFPQSAFPVFDALGDRLNPPPGLAPGRRRAETVRVLVDDRDPLIGYLRGHLQQILEAPEIPELHRIWAMRLVLLHDVEHLMEAVSMGAPLPLHPLATLRTLTRYLPSSQPSGVLVHAVQGDEPSLAAHVLHTTFYALMLSVAAGVDEAERLMGIGIAALFADTGLAGVPRPLELLSAGELSADDARLVRRHPRTSLAHLQRLGPVPPEVCEAVLRHHEWAAVGGDAGVEQPPNPAPFEAACLAIADRYALLTETMSGRRRGSLASRTLRRLSLEAARFDPALLAVFVRLLTPHLAVRRGDR